MHRFFTTAALAALLLTFVFVSAAGATAITFASGDALNEGNNLTPANVVITPVSVWDTTGPGLWVSYANTGAGGSSPPNTTVASGIPTASFWETLNLPYASNTGTFTVWADDTAGVFLRNAQYPLGLELLLKAPNPVQDAHCAAGPIGCEYGEGYTITTSAFTQGLNTLFVDAYQIAGDGFGAKWSGSVNSVPEPGTAFLLLGGALALAGWRRRKLS